MCREKIVSFITAHQKSGVRRESGSLVDPLRLCGWRVASWNCSWSWRFFFGGGGAFLAEGGCHIISAWCRVRPLVERDGWVCSDVLVRDAISYVASFGAFPGFACEAVCDTRAKLIGGQGESVVWVFSTGPWISRSAAL